MAGRLWRREADGLTLFVRLTPKAAAGRLEGVSDTGRNGLALVARVRAAPE